MKMRQATVDYGIDLGTTNSAICRMGPNGPEPILNNQHQAATPSVVAMSKKGQVKVGQDAMRHDYEPKRWFKRLMGSDVVLSMPDGSSWTPQQLSAEILKELKASAKRRYNEDIDTVVITVPAMFNQPQCAATQEAAKLAGLDAVALLQEPIAAATAFLSANPKEGFYLVYDLGGGTFDCSLIRLEDGEMNVIDHGGDNFLGGSDFDKALCSWAITQIKKKGEDTASLEEEGSADRFVLLKEVERTRIALSDDEESVIDLGDLDLDVESLAISRSQLEALIEPFIERTIEIVSGALSRAKLKADNVQGILLVGGPTRTPYVRAKLSEIGIPLNFERDPMTVVAEGAAIHASTILRRKVAGTEQKDESLVELELHYEPVTPESHAAVAGKVVRPSGFKGDIRISNMGGAWETGWVPLVNGAFHVDVTVEAGTVAQFNIELRDGHGTLVDASPAGFAIRSGVRTAQAVLPYNYGVADDEGNVVVLLKVGTPLPTPAETLKFRATKDVPAGSPEEMIVHFVEGTSRIGDENVKVGELAISGKDIERSIKEGQTVEVRMRSDESRLLTARVYLPVQDAEFSVSFKGFIEEPNVDELEEQLGRVQVNLSRISDEVSDEDEDELMQVNRRIEVIEADLERAERGESGEALRLHKQLTDLQATLRPLIDKYALPALHARATKAISDAKYWATRFNDSLDVAKLDDLAREADRYLKLEDEKLLEDVRGRAMGLFWKHYGRTPECWQGQIDLLRERSHWARDEYAFHEYVKRAENCLRDDDLEGSRLNVLRAWDLLPDTRRLTHGLRSDLELA